MDRQEAVALVETGERAAQPLGEMAAVGEPGQRIVIGEVLDMRIGLLLLAPAHEQRQAGNAESEAGEEAERDRGKQEGAMEGGPLFGLVDVGLDDGAYLAAGDHRKVGLRKERRPARRRAFLGIDQRLAVRHGGGRLEIVLGEVRLVGVAFRKVVGDEARRAVGIVDLEQEDLAELLYLVEVGPVEAEGGAPAAIASRSSMVRAMLSDQMRPVAIASS